jgi:hypothetical protein
MFKKSLIKIGLASLMAASAVNASENSQTSGSYTDQDGTRSEDRNGNQTSELNTATGNSSEATYESSQDSSNDYRMFQAVQKDARIYRTTGKVGLALRKAYSEYVVASQEVVVDTDEEAAAPITLSQYASKILQ